MSSRRCLRSQFFLLLSGMQFQTRRRAPALTIVITILVVARPCALGLATPTAVTVGIGRGAELGILIKNGVALEISEKLTTIIFDKTGTLTRGETDIIDIIGTSSTENDLRELLEVAASVEANSQHPLAEAVVRRAREEGITIVGGMGGGFDTFKGKGVAAKIDENEILVGNRTLFTREIFRTLKIPSEKYSSLKTKEKP
ncbi:MAG: putative copper-exporting P-type ATPase A [Candidatus Methanogaster sp.]|nr:MAG: putative copper-exporting P-type ATPase A [ANME-2 cluster archaeon]